MAFTFGRGGKNTARGNKPSNDSNDVQKDEQEAERRRLLKERAEYTPRQPSSPLGPR